MCLSLSARRAWIEISRIISSSSITVSLSARRAWIEIHKDAISNVWACLVALRKESVDRNF